MDQYDWRHRRYTAYYVPDYEFIAADFKHVAECDRLRAYVKEIAKSIQATGLQNPLQVTIHDGKHVVHPGRCRCKALISLGMTSAPAIVVNYDKPGREDGKIPDVPGEVIYSQKQAQSYCSGDVVIEMSRRWLTMKKSSQKR